MIVQTKCRLNNAELSLKLFRIQSKEIRNKMYYKRTKKNGKVRFCLNIDVRKEKVKKENSWLNGLNAIKTNIAFVKDQLNFSSKSSRVARVASVA